MTQGSIFWHLFEFTLPLMLGNLFQLLYNTVDSIVVGNFVGTQALAAVGATTYVVNIAVIFFNGFSTGAGVVISRYFGGKDLEGVHKAVHTAVALTLLMCVGITLLGVLGANRILILMSTPVDVLQDASTYLRIYYLGISGLMIYNMGSGILRAMGDSVRPLIFLIITSLLNIAFDLLFVLAFHMGIKGVAYATILSEFLSAGMVLALLTGNKDIYRLEWKKIGISPAITKEIWAISLPTAFQSVLSNISNVFVQSYINFFGADCIAGWGCYTKLDQFGMLPLQSIGMAASAFVGQNVGAGNKNRVEQGTMVSISMAVGVTAIVSSVLFALAGPAVRMFTVDPEVIRFGILFVRLNIFFNLFNGVNHTLAGCLRGQGDAVGPMAILLFSFVAVRQIYLYVVSHFVANTASLIALGYPIGWVACFVIELTYYFVKYKAKPAQK